MKVSEQPKLIQNIEAIIQKETDPEKKAYLLNLLRAHKEDANLVRDYIFWAFQKSYEQQCRPFRDTMNLEDWEEFKNNECFFLGVLRKVLYSLK